jgi:ribonuclease BN (tRNA processing enzyme)
VRITILGGVAAWPGPGEACSGYVVEHGGFRLLIDPGYATLPRLLARWPAGSVDAVIVSHGHPDHCADLNPLLRARALGADRLPPLPLYAPPGALDAVLALDTPATLAGSYTSQSFTPGHALTIGPLNVTTVLLPHFVPNAGLRISADGASMVYTGDSGPCGLVSDLAAGTDVLLAEATFVDRVPPIQVGHLTSAREAGRQAADAGVAGLILTHLWPGTDPALAVAAAAQAYDGPIDVATHGLVRDVR